MGRLVAQKNFTLFLEVAARVIPDHPSAFFVIAGTGPQEAELTAKAHSLGIADRVRFLGHVTDRLALYHSFDALLMTSNFEGTPMVLLEAMSCALPVVASRVDGIAEVCTNNRDALLIAPGDAGGFVSSVARILKDNNLRSELGTNARATVLKRYEIRELTAQIESLYDDILG
jgi:glycosyltransferase involved in cell wall biosynthesis